CSATPEASALSLHDALPICARRDQRRLIEPGTSSRAVAGASPGTAREGTPGQSARGAAASGDGNGEAFGGNPEARVAVGGGLGGSGRAHPRTPRPDPPPLPP